jgi:nucleoside phosphorylase
MTFCDRAFSTQANMSANKYDRPRDRFAFEVAIFCALTFEADAMIALFDDIWESEEQYEKADGDTNTYTIGRIGQLHVVLVHLPYMGKVSAASVAASLRSSFPRIRLGLLVGVCGGVPFIPTSKRELILGDIVISTQIVQADFGRLYPDALIRKDRHDNLGRPNSELRSFLLKLQGKEAQIELETQIQTNLAALFDSGNFESSKYPGALEDKLFEATYRHKHQEKKACTICAQCGSPDDSVCASALGLPCIELRCDASKLVPRARIQKRINKDISASYYTPMIHFGALASGDQVVRSALHRDRIAEQENVIAFEMEGTGLCETIPTIVVKGVCDYADSHKDKVWQPYAAATAAACAKGLLKAWRVTMRPALGIHHGEAAVLPRIHQVFSGNFIAGKNVHNSGTFISESINF